MNDAASRGVTSMLCGRSLQHSWCEREEEMLQL